MSTKKSVVTETTTTISAQAVEMVPEITEVKETKKTKKVKTVKENKEKVNVAITVMDNDTLKKLFQSNGCATYTNASNKSSVVYNTFGTKSRILQQQQAYQLLLTNGHKSTKHGIIETDNDDAKKFGSWYETLSDEQKKSVVGFDSMMNTKLSASEMPRERTVKLVSYDLLVEFIKFMATFEENKLAIATE